MINIDISVQELPEELELEVKEYVGGTGMTDYNHLINLPFLNGRELKGEFVLSEEDIGISYADNFDIEDMFREG